ncbi:hypothetical protein EVG20_g7385 [Dentipellis fragilis]|uniref:CAP-Gly domain-containing protein n=1 Tax=Dentipellis fragilis TaxID=205917 RepID=A0A4Y9YDB5_9AGAM|nr:hypothetical protein EVG20_g7385 [Dentipellis fragilis]
MSSTPGKARQSGIPTPGKASGIPTPGRLRSTSAASQNVPAMPDADLISRAFADAIKANDPARHRSSRTSDVSDSTLSVDTTLAVSGRRSVTGRTSAFAGSTPSRTPQYRAKTPVQRPASRQSDVFTRTSSRADMRFNVGDSVRIESLGFEGTLRYLGAIDGKAGEWAGVELSGGFTGKGKNDGAVNGKHYFQCPPKCGVFVATTKLSAPTAGPSTSRPASVASSRGRVTPSLSGRVTPSTAASTGRITPYSSRSTSFHNSNRATSSAITPTARPRMRAVTPSNTTVSANQGSSNYSVNYTPGSRASRYVGVTAKQLNSRGLSHTRADVSSPSSPTRPGSNLWSRSPNASPALGASPSSSFKTPTAGSVGRATGIGIGMPSTTPTKQRSSVQTPRGRIPSAVAMPPPASPLMSSNIDGIVSLDDRRSEGSPSRSPDILPLSDLESNGHALQDRIKDLLSGKPLATNSHTPPPSTSSAMPTIADDNSTASLKCDIETLTSENQRLSRVLEAMHLKEAESVQRSDALRADRDQALSRVSELENLCKTAERNLDEKATKVEALERSVANTLADVEKVRNDGDARIRDLQSRLDDKETLVKNLKDALELKNDEQNENDAVLKAKDSEITLLEARVQKAYTELDDERKELGGQVDELRQAGQETIALYEERLSAAEAKRYELEDSVTSLQEQLRQQAETPSPPSGVGFTSYAAQIENETLPDKEEAALRDKIRRHRDKEEILRKQHAESQAELERVLKSEAHARSRLDEIEEAFREGTVALENARAEIETLRSEIADLETLASNPSSTDSTDKLTDILQRAASERAKSAEEIALLKRTVHELTLAKREAAEDLENHRTGSQDAGQPPDVDNQELRRLYETSQRELAEAMRTVAEMQTRSESRSSDLNTPFKKSSLDGQEDARHLSSSTSRHEPTIAREEIAGLKHIIQELQKENTAAAQHNKLLESENKLLLSETQKLRNEMSTWEENLERRLANSNHHSNQQTAAGKPQQEIQDLEVKHEMELEQLRKKQADIEMKNARTIHDLHKEVSELESLIESKIYREDELEHEIDRLKDKLSRSQKKLSKGASESNGSLDSLSTKSDGGQQSGDVCEICEQPGHDIFTCDVLKGDGAAPEDSTEMADVFCLDCESHGHVAADFAAENAPPSSRQPHADPSLLTTPTDPPAAVADDTSKVNVVPTDFKQHPETTTSEFREELAAKGAESTKRTGSSKRTAKKHGNHPTYRGVKDIWQVVKNALLLPGVAVNIGLLSGAGYLYYTEPRLRNDARVISCTLASTLAVLGLEGYVAESYRNTSEGQKGEGEARSEGSMAYRSAREHLLRPGVLGGFLGLVNLAVMSSVGYISFVNWDKPHWDRRVVSIATLGVVSLWGGEGLLAQWYRGKK